MIFRIASAKSVSVELMEALLYIIARGLIAFLQMLPLTWVARAGRGGGAVAYFLDGRHRRVALRNISMCFASELSQTQIRELARENFRRIGENFACAVKTAAMSYEQLAPRVEFFGDPAIVRRDPKVAPRSVVTAIGHFGNFELYARFGQMAPGYKCATTYRGLREPSLNRLLQELRERSGCKFFERRFDAAPLKAFMHQPSVMLGLLADQHAGPSGLRLPFLDHECSTSSAPAVFALRYHCALHTGICHRVGLAKWRIEAGPEIPTMENGHPRKVANIMLDVNRAFEAAVRRDPANWFWVHNRWKLQEADARKRQREAQAAAMETEELAGENPS
jgi:lauroyl/myristoyl acyltransferase